MYVVKVYNSEGVMGLHMKGVSLDMALKGSSYIAEAIQKGEGFILSDIDTESKVVIPAAYCQARPWTVKIFNQETEEVI